MYRDNGLVVMTETEYNSMTQAKSWEIKELEKRCDMLQNAIMTLTRDQGIRTEDIRIPKLDFIQMHEKAVDDMFDRPADDKNDIYGYDITIHWHGMYCNCSDGATPSNYIIPALQELCEEDPDEY